MSNRWCFGALSVGSVPTPSPLHVDEGCFSRRHPTREPSVTFSSSYFFSSTSAAGGVTSGVFLDGCVGCRYSLNLSEFSLFDWIVSLLSAMPRFGGYAGNWFNGYVGVGRAMAELRWAAGFFCLEGDENCQGRWVAVASMERSSTWESKHWKPYLWMMNFELDQFYFQWEKEVNRELETEAVGGLQSTPNRDCGCSRGLQQLFDSYCYGDGSNHLIFVTRIKAVFFGSRQPFGFSV
ncbi:hypothetical protein Peur_071885 [Populus x canadensis]